MGFNPKIQGPGTSLLIIGTVSQEIPRRAGKLTTIWILLGCTQENAALPRREVSSQEIFAFELLDGIRRSPIDRIVSDYKRLDACVKSFAFGIFEYFRQGYFGAVTTAG
jgi:hypothetical protein